MSEQQVKGGGAQRLCLRGGHAGEGVTKIHWVGGACKKEFFSLEKKCFFDMYTSLYLFACMLSPFSGVQLFATLWTIAHPPPPRLLFPWDLQARIQEGVAISSSRGSSLSKDRTHVS